MMKYNREDKIKILEYKFVFEEALQVQKEYEEGTADLNYRLSFFRKKLDDNNSTNKQKDIYDSMFMGKQTIQNEKDASAIQTDSRELTKSATKSSTNIKHWAKKVYRQIVMVTHPDKVSEIQSEHLKQELMNKYRITQNAYAQELYSDLIMVAFDLNIDFQYNL